MATFYVIPYVDRNGIPTPVAVPEKGPCLNRDDKACKIRVHHHRPRLTGPRHKLTVVRCSTHGKYFTIYPPGYGPHMRIPLVPTAYGTCDPLAVKEPETTFADTLFQAAFDAREGRAWSREWTPPPRSWWQSQRRHLARAQTLLGLVPETDSITTSRIAEILDVDYMLLSESRAHVAARPGYRHRGEVITSVLQDLMNKGSPVVRFTIAGHRAGLWGEPLWWDVEAGIIRRVPFRLAGSE